MSTLGVAKKDFLDVRRAKIVWFVAGVYALFMLLIMYFNQDGRTTPDVQTALWDLTGIGALFIPLIALVGAYLAIAGERESGSIKYLLALPNSRRDVVLGKYLTRSLVVAVSVAGAFGLGAILALVWYPSLESSLFLGFAGLTILYALTYVGVAIGISATAESRSRAMGGAIGFYFVTNVLTIFGSFSIIGALDWVLNSVLGVGISEDVLEFMRALISPTVAYLYSTSLVFPSDFRDIPADVVWYLEGEVMLLILLCWLVVPVLLGLWWFGRVDLG